MKVGLQFDTAGSIFTLYVQLMKMMEISVAHITQQACD